VEGTLQVYQEFPTHLLLFVELTLGEKQLILALQVLYKGSD
jgi:hypothetical protein